MQIGHEFDESNADRRERMFARDIRTAKKFNVRIKHFIKNIDRNYSLTKGQKNIIKSEIIKNL